MLQNIVKSLGETKGYYNNMKCSVNIKTKRVKDRLYRALVDYKMTLIRNP